MEALLRRHDDVGDAVVDVRSIDDGPAFLVAHVTPAAGVDVDVHELRAGLAEWLPPQAVPSRIVTVPELPITASGKVDRAALARIDFEGATASTDGAEAGATTSLLGIVRDIWSQVFRAEVAEDRSFFDSGGDSMLAAEVAARTIGAFDIDPQHGSALVRGLLTAASVADFAAAVQTAVDGIVAPVVPEWPDFWGDGRLAAALPARRDGHVRPDGIHDVLLTGATGFVGSFLLDALLRSTGARIHCPVRARDAAHARRRVVSALRGYGLERAAAELVDDGRRAECFAADIAEPNLGLAAEHSSALSECLDLVVHAAADVNFLYPYAALQNINVGGTKRIIELASPRRVPVHFISTVAVLAGCGAAGVTAVAEDDVLAHPEGISMGYAESKWVAERALQEAADQGLPIAVHRPYEVTGEQRSGVCNTETAICSLFETIARTGVAPDIALPMDFVPVDFLADAVVHIATTVPTRREVYHVTSPHSATFGDVIERMRVAGFDVKTLDYSAWVDELVRFVTANPSSPTAPFVSLCVDRANTAPMTVKELFFEGTFPRLGRANFEAALRGSGLTQVPVDAKLLDLYLDYFFESGFIPRP